MIKTIAFALLLSVLLNTSCNKVKDDSSVGLTLNVKCLNLSQSGINTNKDAPTNNLS